MEDRISLRIAGIVTLLGGVGAIIVNVLHPRPPDVTEELLQVVASIPHWTILHFFAAFTAVFILSGLALLVRTLQDPAARAIGEVGKYATLSGVAVFLAAIIIDGYGYPYYAHRWIAATGEEKSLILFAANAVHTVDLALFLVWVALFMGLGILLIAVALLCSKEYSRVFAVLGLIGASMSLAYAWLRVLRVTTTLPLWPLGAALNALWITALGVYMVKKAMADHRV
jgi:hypothetical protein